MDDRRGEKRALSLTIGLVPSRGARTFIGRECLVDISRASISRSLRPPDFLHSYQPDVQLQTRNNERDSCSLGYSYAMVSDRIHYRPVDELNDDETGLELDEIRDFDGEKVESGRAGSWIKIKDHLR